MILRRLPDPVPPARHEIAVSYIHRLATIHGLDIESLWLQVTELTEHSRGLRIVVPDRLAELTGRSTYALAGAIPELRRPWPKWKRFRYQPQAGCHRCDARHLGGTVQHLLPQHRYVCLRHRTWIGPPDIDQNAADLSAFPEIVRAQRKHLRLVHRFGWRRTYEAMLTSFMFCGQVWTTSDHDIEYTDHVRNVWKHRAQQLIPDENNTFSTSRLFAAIYPEAVALARLVAAPYWRLVAMNEPFGLHQFLAEVSRHVTYPYRDDHENYDPFARWALLDSWRLDFQPTKAFKPARRSGKPPVLHGARLRRHENDKRWFRHNANNNGRRILKSSHLTPILHRPRFPNFEEAEGPVWSSVDHDQETRAFLYRERHHFLDVSR